jgi:hypothetical protein
MLQNKKLLEVDFNKLIDMLETRKCFAIISAIKGADFFISNFNEKELKEYTDGEKLNERGQNLIKRLNKERTQDLKNALKSLEYSFYGVGGGWRDVNSGVDYSENSYVVTKENISLLEGDVETFKSNLIKLGIEFNQDAVLIAEIENDSRFFRYYDSTGKITAQFKNKNFDDVLAEYFTKVTKGQKESNQRFTLTESFLGKWHNDKPQSVGYMQAIAYRRKRF